MGRWERKWGRKSCFGAIDLGDAAGGAQAGDDLGEVAQVAHFDIHQAFEKILLAVDDFEGFEGGVLFGDGVGEVGEGVGGVGGDDADAAGEGFVFVGAFAGLAELGVVPIDIDEAFGRVGEGFEGEAIFGVDGDTFAGGDDTGDGIAGERVAAAGVMDFHTGNEAGDGQRAGFGRARGAGEHAGDGARAAIFAQSGIGGVDDVFGAEIAGGDGDVEIIEAGDFEGLEDGFEDFFAAIDAVLAEGAGERGFALVAMLDADLLGEEAADAGAGFAGDDEAFPGGGGGAAAGGEDFDLIAILQGVAQGHQAAIDARPDASIADLGMDGVGEIDRGGAARQLDQLAFGGEAENLILVEFKLGVFEELIGGGGVFENFQEVLHPAELFEVGVGGFGAFFGALFVEPMGGDAVFGDVVHFGGADLHFDFLVAWLAEGHAGMQRAVEIGFGGGDIVFEAPGDHGEGGVDGAEGDVAGIAGGDDDAEGHDVGELFEGNVAALHFFPDRENRFFAAEDFDGVDAGVAADAHEVGADFLDHVSPLAAQEVEAVLDRVEGFGVDDGEGAVLQFDLDALHADAFGEGGVDFHGFAGDAHGAVAFGDEMDGAHIMQPVGELDQQDADILAHGEDELAEIFGLFGAIGLEFEAGEFGHAIDEAGDFGAEAGFEFGERNAGIFDHVMQQGGGDAGGIEPVIGQDVCDGDGMGDVGIAIVAALGGVGGGGDVEGVFDDRGVGFGIVRADAREEWGDQGIAEGAAGAPFRREERRGRSRKAVPPRHSGMVPGSAAAQAAAAEFRFDRGGDVFGGHFLGFGGQGGGFFLGGDVLQAENILIGRD